MDVIIKTIKMKKLIFISIFLANLFVTAQTKNELFEITAKETCECINEVDLKTLSRKQIKSRLGICMLNSYGVRKDKFIQFGVNFNIDSAKNIGEEVGIKMATICPEVFTSFIEEKETEEQYSSIAGLYKKISGNDINYIHIIDENGKNQKFMWFGNFKGSNRFIEKRDSINKVIVYYKNTEYYVPKMKEYFTVKEITEIVYND